MSSDAASFSSRSLPSSRAMATTSIGSSSSAATASGPPWPSPPFYYLLKRLSERGLLEPDEGSQGRRTVFRVTEAGRRELRQAAGERVLAPAPPSAGVLPALNAYSRLDDPELVTLLVRRAEALLGRLDELRALRAQVDEEHALAIFDYEILRQEADLAWTRSLLKKAGSDED